MYPEIEVEEKITCFLGIAEKETVAMGLKGGKKTEFLDVVAEKHWSKGLSIKLSSKMMIEDFEPRHLDYLFFTDFGDRLGLIDVAEDGEVYLHVLASFDQAGCGCCSTNWKATEMYWDEESCGLQCEEFSPSEVPDGLFDADKNHIIIATKITSDALMPKWSSIGEVVMAEIGL